MTEVIQEPKTKTPTVREMVAMEDGTQEEFVGKRKMNKSFSINDDGTVVARFAFRNGNVRTYQLGDSLFAQFAGHGALQKIGDETASEDEVEDMVVSVDAILARLNDGKWGAERKSGDGFSGASIVIRAISEVSGKTIEEVKAFLEKKLAADESLTRQALYKSFRNPASKTGQAILRLEREKAEKSSGPSGDELLAELEAPRHPHHHGAE